MKNQQLQELNKKILDEQVNKDIVLGYGNINSTLVLIGEAPGAKEVELKMPFVGQAGKNLNEFLNAIELDRDKLYITNVVKYRPTKKSKKTNGVVNRPPTIKEIENFKKYLMREIQIVSPQIIVTLGNTPLKALFNKDVKIGNVHGEILETKIKENVYKVFPLYHPAAIIYRRALKSLYVEDLKKLKSIIND